MNIKRGKKRLLIGVPILSAFLSFFGGVRLWAEYESLGYAWGAGVVFAFIILFIWFFVRTLRWIIKGFDLHDDKWMSIKDVDDKREELLDALQENNVILRREKLRVIVEEYDHNDYQKPEQNNWWKKNFEVTTDFPDYSKSSNRFNEYKLYGFVFMLVILGSIVITILIVRLFGQPPS